jgi:hypothetical protein
MFVSVEELLMFAAIPEITHHRVILFRKSDQHYSGATQMCCKIKCSKRLRTGSK